MLLKKVYFNFNLILVFFASKSIGFSIIKSNKADLLTNNSSQVQVESSLDLIPNNQSNELNHRTQNKMRKKLKRTKKSLKFQQKRSESENEYKKYLNIDQIKSDKPGYYCGETLYYVVEYYCVYVKGTSVYSPDNDLDDINVISKRQTGESGGIVDECCYRACKSSELDKYCN